MKTITLLIAVTAATTFALPTLAQTSIDTKAAPNNPAMPYRISDTLTGAKHGTVAIFTKFGQEAFKALGSDSLAYGAQVDNAQAPNPNSDSIKLVITPDAKYIIRTGYPKVYKTGSTTTSVTLTDKADEGTAKIKTFIMQPYPVTVELAYAMPVSSIDTLTMTGKQNDAAGAIAYLTTNHAYLPIKLVNGKADSLKVATGGWTLKGSSYDASSGAANEFSCKLVSLPDSLDANGKLTLSGTDYTAIVRIVNKTQKTIRITDTQTYTSGNNNEDNIIIAATGHLTWNNTGDVIDTLTIEEGGQLTIAKPMPVSGCLRTDRNLKNVWSAYGTPVEQQASVAKEDMFYTKTGYKTSATIDQLWQANTSASISGTASATITASTPYLIALESATEQKVTFTAQPATAGDKLTLPVVNDSQIQTGDMLHTGIFRFCMNPTLHNVTIPMAYILSDDGRRFELTNNVLVKPFQSYLVANEVTAASVKILRTGSMATANEQPILPNGSFRIWGSNGVLHLAADEMSNVTIYDFSGRLVRQFTLTGEQTIELGRGLYLVHSNNITYKVSL